DTLRRVNGARIGHHPPRQERLIVQHDNGLRSRSGQKRPHRIIRRDSELSRADLEMAAVCSQLHKQRDRALPRESVIVNLNAYGIHQYASWNNGVRVTRISPSPSIAMLSGTRSPERILAHCRSANSGVRRTPSSSYTVLRPGRVSTSTHSPGARLIGPPTVRSPTPTDQLSMPPPSAAAVIVHTGQTSSSPGLDTCALSSVTARDR